MEERKNGLSNVLKPGTETNRWSGASHRANGSGVDERPVAGGSAGQQVVRAGHRFLAPHASVLRFVSSAAQLPFR